MSREYIFQKLSLHNILLNLTDVCGYLFYVGPKCLFDYFSDENSLQRLKSTWRDHCLMGLLLVGYRRYNVTLFCGKKSSKHAEATTHTRKIFPKVQPLPGTAPGRP